MRCVSDTYLPVCYSSFINFITMKMGDSSTVMKIGPTFILGGADEMGRASASRVLAFPCDYVNGGGSDGGGDVDSQQQKTAEAWQPYSLFLLYFLFFFYARILCVRACIRACVCWLFVFAEDGDDSP